ncbi:MAG TPA: hypothetical protein VHB97_08795 [Polyangia bacterium]|nr:hypothetical protein [Polyangia bacterium]
MRESIAAEVAKVIGARRVNGTSAKGHRRRKRADGTAVQKKLLDLLGGAKKGLATGDIAQKTDVHRGAIEYHLRVLRAKKKTRVVGNRGQARWFAA